MKKLHRNIIYTSLLLVLAAALLVQTIAGAAVSIPADITDSKPKEEISILLQLKLMSVREDGLFYEDEPISRGEFSAIVSKITGVPTSDTSEAEMPAASAIEKLVDLLGYGTLAKVRGYDKIASQLKLTSNEKILTRAEAARLVYDALQTRMMEAAGFGEKVKYSNKNSETMIEKYMDMTFVKGRIEANSISAIKPYSIPGESRVILDGITYVDQAGAEQEIGRTVIAVVSKDSGFAELYAFVPESTRYEDTVIHAADLIPDETKIGVICYESASGSSTRKTFSEDAVIVYNGEVMEQYADRDFRIANGEIVLAYSKSGAVETVYINEYTTHIASGANAYGMKVFFKDGEKPLELDEDNKNLFIYVDGAPGGLGDISEFDAVDIYRTRHSDKITLKVTTKRLLGVYQGADEEEIRIDGKAYERTEEIFGSDNLEWGKKYSFILNSENLVCGVDTTVKEVGSYGYLYKVLGDEDAPEEGIKLRILTTDNQFESIPIVDKLKIDEKKYKLEDFYKNTNPLLQNGEGKRQVIMYVKNDEGAVCEVYTAADNTAYQNPSAQLRLDAALKRSTRMYRNTFGINYRFSGQTKVFILPPDGSDDELDYSCTTIGDWGEDHTFDNYEIYNTKRSREISAFVTYEAVKEEGFSAAKQKSNIVLVAKNQQTVNDDGMDSYRLTYYEAGAEKTALFEDSEVCNQYPNAWSQYPKTLTAADVKKGDILQLVLNSRGEIREFHMLYRIEDKETAYSETLPTGYSYTADSVPLSYLYTAFGEIVDLYGGTITVDVNNTTDPDNEAYHRNFKLEGVTSYLLYENGKVSKILSDEIMLGDKVFVRAYNYIPYNVIVIR